MWTDLLWVDFRPKMFLEVVPADAVVLLSVQCDFANSGGFGHGDRWWFGRKECGTDGRCGSGHKKGKGCRGSFARASATPAIVPHTNNVPLK